MRGKGSSVEPTGTLVGPAPLGRARLIEAPKAGRKGQDLPSQGLERPENLAMWVPEPASMALVCSFQNGGIIIPKQQNCGEESRR